MAIVLTAKDREQLHRQLDEMLDQLPQELRELGQAEETIEAGLQKLGKASLQAWADTAQRSSGSVPLCPECGQSMRHRGLARRMLVTIHGTIVYARPRRRCDCCGRESYEEDGALCFGSHGVSWKVAQRVTRLASLLPSFEMARELLWEDYGIELSKHTIECIVNEAGGMLLEGDDARRAACFAVGEKGAVRGPKESPISPEMTVVYADGTMIHTEDDWREIRVGRVISENAGGQRLRQETFARFLSLEAFGQQLFVAAYAAGYGKAKRWAFLGDGAHWVWELAQFHFPEAVLILDWYHLSENVHAAADVVFGEGSEESQRWAETRLQELWEGEHRLARGAVAELYRQRRGRSVRRCES